MAKQPITDEELNLKRHARRRLIGAVTLVLAVVVILPMVFDGEPTPGTPSEIELRIPPREVLPPMMPPAASEPVASVAAQPETAQSTPAAVPVAASAVTPSVIPETSGPKDERTVPVAAGKPMDKPTPRAVAKTGWAVQVGAYSNHETAKNLAARLGKQGFRVYTEQVGNMVRVRVGSYPTREAADKIRIKLEKLGLHPNLINLESP